jgi:hypothetical protein
MPRLRRVFSRTCVHSSSISAWPGVGQPKHPWVRFALTLSLALAFAFIAGMPVAQAQQESGAIVGTVSDASGAAVKGATVTVKDIDRGASLTVQTNDDGSYDFPRVPVGNYEVSVSQTGFQTARHDKFTLVLNQTARLDFQLKVGQTTETVEVTGAAPVLDTDTSLLSSLIDSKVATDLPLATHNTNQLTLIASPGVITPNLFGQPSVENQAGRSDSRPA